MSIDIKSFLQNVEDQFMETTPGAIQADTQFRELEEWSSLLGLMIITMIDEKYQVIITGDEIRSSNSFQDIYDLVCHKQATA